MEQPIADLHCHPSLKPHLNPEIGSIWDYAENPTVDAVFRLVSIRKLVLRFATTNLALKTQSNLDSCYLGGNRLLFCSIYPFEREFLRPDRPFKRASALLRWTLQLLLKRHYKKKIDVKLLRLITGISAEEAEAFLDQIHADGEHVNYMEDYLREYNYLIAAQGPRPKGPLENSGGAIPEFRLAREFSQLPDPLNTSLLAGIVSVEGVHGFGKYKLEDLRSKNSFDELSDAAQSDLRNSFQQNLLLIKDPLQTEFPPLFATFTHHFHNFLGGHAQSFGGLFQRIFNQQPGRKTGFSALGLEVLELLLERGPNKARILVDTKHMAAELRKEFYALIRQRRQQGDAIPIVSSHSAVNALPNLDAAISNNNSSSTDKRSYVSKFAINLTDEDIRETYDSDGLIGICMHDGRMPGKKFKRKLRAVRAYPEKAKRLYSQMFLTNILHVVRVITSRIREQDPAANESELRRAWDHVCLGSDNDGIVDPFNTYETAADLQDFRAKIVEALQTQDRPYMKEFRILSLPAEEPMPMGLLKELMAGLSAEQIADRIFYGNTREFLRKYFTREYLYNQSPVV